MESVATEEMAYRLAGSMPQMITHMIAPESEREIIKAQSARSCTPRHSSSSAGNGYSLSPQKTKYRATFSLAPALEMPLELYRKNGGNASALASHLLSLYFAGDIGKDDEMPHYSFLKARIEEKQAELNRLAALVTSAQERKEEQKKEHSAKQDTQIEIIRAEFADAAKNPRAWRHDLRIDGFDPDAVIRCRAQSLSDRFGIQVSRVIGMIREEVPGLLPVKGEGVKTGLDLNTGMTREEVCRYGI